MLLDINYRTNDSHACPLHGPNEVWDRIADPHAQVPSNRLCHILDFGGVLDRLPRHRLETYGGSLGKTRELFDDLYGLSDVSDYPFVVPAS